ncbi:hypothetical protein Q9233_016752 [Columba guinea]|nr:hypothetical protein Q9233_016752 [Columba guinea]
MPKQRALWLSEGDCVHAAPAQAGDEQEMQASAELRAAWPCRCACTSPCLGYQPFTQIDPTPEIAVNPKLYVFFSMKKSI